jgi:PKD repeat protein
MFEFSGYAVSDANHIQIGFGADMPAVDDYAVIMSSGGNSYVSRQYGDGSGLKTYRSDTLNSIASWGIAYTPSSLMYYHNGALKAAHTKTMSAHLVGFATAYQTLHIDWVIVRAYSATPPAATTFSGEQETAGLQPFPGLTLIPRDLAGTGLYTDINGNNRLDYNDLTIFFQNLAWAKTAQPIACFDFNGNGWLDYNDVITLFSTIMEEHT